MWLAACKGSRISRQAASLMQRPIDGANPVALCDPYICGRELVFRPPVRVLQWGLLYEARFGEQFDDLVRARARCAPSFKLHLRARIFGQVLTLL